MMHTYDEAYLLDLNKKFIEEVLKHGVEDPLEF